MCCFCLQLNSGQFQPHTIPETKWSDCLVTAPLQLAAHTQLLLDETLLQAGQLGTIGCSNLEVMHCPPSAPPDPGGVYMIMQV